MGSSGTQVTRLLQHRRLGILFACSIHRGQSCPCWQDHFRHLSLLGAWTETWCRWDCWYACGQWLYTYCISCWTGNEEGGHDAGEELWWGVSEGTISAQVSSVCCYGFSYFLTSLVTLTTLTFSSTVQPVHLFLSHLYSFALLSAATRIASLFLFHYSYVFLPSLYAVPLGLCAFSCSINTSSVLM